MTEEDLSVTKQTFKILEEEDDVDLKDRCRGSFVCDLNSLED